MSEGKSLGDYIDEIDNENKNNSDTDIKFRFRKVSEGLDSLKNIEKTNSLI